MSNIWKVQDAKARFSEFLDASLEQGPQIITRRGVQEAVLVPIEQWKALEAQSQRSIKDWLLAPTPRVDGLIAPRPNLRHRKPPSL